MLKYILVLSFILPLGIAHLKADSYETLSAVFAKEENFVSHQFSKQTIRFYIKEKALSDEEADILKRVDKINFLCFDKEFNLQNEQYIFNLIAQIYNLNDYHLFRHESGQLGSRRIYLQEDDKQINRFLLILNANDKSSFVELKGKIKRNKLAQLGILMNIDGMDIENNYQNLESESHLIADKQLNEKALMWNKNVYLKNAPIFDYNPWYVDLSSSSAIYPKRKKFAVYNHYGQLTYRIDSDAEPNVKINGLSMNIPVRDALALLKPDCVHSIKVNEQADETEEVHPNGLIEVELIGAENQAFIICEGNLFFAQDSVLECININDPFAPVLVRDCEKFKLKEIKKISPQEVKSIKLSDKDENCDNLESGDYIVIQTK